MSDITDFTAIVIMYYLFN